MAFKEKLIGLHGAELETIPRSRFKSDLQLCKSVAMQNCLALENSQLTQAIA